jgi:hypothetical protein
MANSPAQLGLDRSIAAGVLAVLDKAGSWVNFGTVDSAAHTIVLSALGLTASSPNDPLITAQTTGTTQSAIMKFLAGNSGSKEWDIVAAGSGLGADSLRFTRAGWTNAALMTLFGAGNPTFEVKPAAPTWASYSGIFNGALVNIGSYPNSQMFGNNAVPIVQAFTAALAIPSTAVGDNHGAALNGYANTMSVRPTGQGAVGVFGFAGYGVAGGDAWSFNSVASNGLSPQPTNAGFDGAVTGYEVDINIEKTAAVANPNVNVRGILLVGGGGATGIGTGYSHGIEIQSLSIVNGLKWQDGISFIDGAATRAITIGADSSASDAGSMPVQWNSRRLGVAKAAAIVTNNEGDFNINPQSGRGVSLGGWCAVQSYLTVAGNADLTAGNAYTVNSINVADDAAWTTYTPTIASGTGSITTLGAVTARYKRQGKRVHVRLSISITTNGTGATSITATLPLSPAYSFTGSGHEETAYGGLMQVRGAAGGGLTILKADNTYPGANGALIIIGATYEI